MRFSYEGWKLFFEIYKSSKYLEAVMILVMCVGKTDSKTRIDF